MSLLQCPRQCNLAVAGICHLCSIPCEHWDVRGDRTAGNLKMAKIKHYCIKAFHIYFVPSALSCALPAFLLFFLPGN
ncbi:unnamed protein product [Staurois parvus]|uniref:Uncharacterized protein n=1 Tax=Staurois parvus TaxID=386267 RepID=A0ABN9CVV5_9NEOB|nr:unnamed protein product [Staurois parvus]